MRLGSAALALAGAASVAFLSDPAFAARIPEVAVSATDYPNGVQPGPDIREVRVRYTLRADGSVADCSVARSSGLETIDAETCRIVRERGFFHAARQGGELKFRWLGAASLGNGDVRGAPLAVDFLRIATMSAAQVRAAMREDDRHGSANLEIDVSRDGAPQRCTVARVDRAAALSRWWCDAIMRSGTFIPATDGAGGRAPGIYRLRIGWG